MEFVAQLHEHVFNCMLPTNLPVQHSRLSSPELDDIRTKKVTWLGHDESGSEDAVCGHSHARVVVEARLQSSNATSKKSERISDHRCKRSTLIPQYTFRGPLYGRMI